MTLMEREQISKHAANFGLEDITPGLVLSNVETQGINLMECVGFHMRIGDEAVVHFYRDRIPCARMEANAVGLWKAMKRNQGVFGRSHCGWSH